MKHTKKPAPAKDTAAPGQALTKARWNALHDEVYALWQKIEAAEDEDAPAIEEARQRYGELCEAYSQQVPRVAIARCPFSEREVIHSVDTFGLRGLWWRYRHPVRPVEPPRALGPHFLVLTGAARIPKKVPDTPHLVRPGPAVPFVLPRLFALGEVTAVIRGLRVGGQRAWAVSYFARRPRVSKASWGLANTWASENSPLSTPQLSFADEADLGDTEYAYDLEPHVREERLLWIAEDDEGLTLRRGLARCPYLGLKGRREMVRLQEGEAW